jgi:quercetin dioxygenase-like cupin family protein
MTRSEIESAVAQNTPFSLITADGREYSVPRGDYLSFPPNVSSVVVYDDEGRFHVLPLLTITGFSGNFKERE